MQTVLCYNGYLTDLSLKDNYLTDISLITLIRIFENTPDLKIIDISYNKISCDVEDYFS